MQITRLNLVPFLVLLIVTLSCSLPVDSPQTTPTPDLRMTATALMDAISSPQSSLPASESTPSVKAPLETDENFVEIDPYVEVNATATDIVVGETLTVTGEPVDIQLPQYEVVLRDEGVQDALPVVLVSFENQVTSGEGRSQVLELVSVQGSTDRVEVTLKAIGSGVVSVDIIATGEIQISDGSAPIVGMGAGTVLVVVGDE